MNKMCPNCGREYSDELPSCPYCAENVSEKEETSEQPKSNEFVDEKAAVQDGFEQPDFSDDFNDPSSPNGKKSPSKKTIIAITASAVVVIVVIILLAVFVFGNNNHGGDGAGNGGNTSATEELTMPSGYEEIIENIEDEDGNIITQAVDSYGNTITREVDEDGNIVTTYVGLDGTTSTVTTDREGNIISYDIPSTSSSAGSSSAASSGNTSTNNNSSSAANSQTSSSESSSHSSSGSSSNNTSSNQQTSDGTVTINGKQFEVGDTVTMRMTVGGINELVAGFQFGIDYDNELLELNADSVIPYNSSCIMNTNLNGSILMNCISASVGVEFSAPVQVLECKFTVNESTSKACDISVDMNESQICTGVGTQEIVDVTNQAEIDIEVE